MTKPLQIFLKLLLKNFAGLFGKHGLSRSQATRKMIFSAAVRFFHRRHKSEILLANPSSPPIVPQKLNFQ